ncbi:MAG TPA: amino acid ABC transporter permease [Pseudonocardiaceae bacterium]|nr:amino acid ABC transporter permease [Pseudonocardiaceae bacterium]
MIDLLRRAAPLLWDALYMTVLLGVSSFVIGVGIGLGAAVGRLSRFRTLRTVIGLYVSLFRGTPVLLQVLLVYYGLPQLGVEIAPVPAVIIALSLHAGAYLTETFRAGITAVDTGQRDAAHSMGMTGSQQFRRVILPQAVRIVVPPVGNQFISLMKDTSLASVVTVVELTRVAEIVGSSTFRYLEMFVVAGLIYWIICTLLAVGQEVLERRLGRVNA